MIADGKAKAAGFDKKRIYTAIAALVIAGAAGHFMQRTAGAPGANNTVLTASVPGTPTAGAPRIEQPAAPQVLAASVAPGFVPAAAPAGAAAELLPATPEKADIPEIILTEVVQPEAVAPTAELEIGAAPDLAGDLAEPAFPDAEVTRAASEPILAVAEPAEPAVAPDAESMDITLAAAGVIDDLSSEASPPVVNCDIALDAGAQDGALVAITLSAPCNAGEKVNFDHAGLMFSEQLGPEGDLFLLAPAMAEQAVFVVSFADGQEKVVEVTLPDFAEYERLALVWKGATGLQLHALENGAGYDDPGHLWAEQPATLEAATAGTGGFVSVLGSTADGYAADVYTYPASLAANGTQPEVSVEAQVMENTCGSEIAGSILRTNAGRPPIVLPLAMAVPGCDAVGEYLVLNNLPQDLKLARN
jgi:hypothetical protein